MNAEKINRAIDHLRTGIEHLDVAIISLIDYPVIRADLIWFRRNIVGQLKHVESLLPHKTLETVTPGATVYESANPPTKI